jgi:hypothetical protein
VPYLLLGLQDVQWAVGNSRGARKLARTPHVNKKKKKRKTKTWKKERVKNRKNGGTLLHYRLIPTDMVFFHNSLTNAFFKVNNKRDV